MTDTATGGKRDYAADLLQRIDEHLEGLPREERRAFLGRQLSKWSANFARWQALVEADESTAVFGDACALDFHNTIAGINQRIAAELQSAA